MAISTVSFRSQARGVVTDLVDEAGLACGPSQNLILAAVGALVDYTEEGASLSPVIIFCGSVKAFTNLIPGSVNCEIGKAKNSADSIKQILKDCAPLSSEDCVVYIERIDGVHCNYGVLSFPSTPSTLAIKDILGVVDQEFSFAIFRSGSYTVQINSKTGKNLKLSFSTTRESSEDESDEITKFTRQCVASIAEDSEEFLKYYIKFIKTIVELSHGTILICKSSESTEIASLKDKINIDPNLDFFNLYEAFRKDQSANALAALRARENLLRGMVASDGVVIFTDNGMIAGYRAFFAPDENGHVPVVVVGGARRRAFEGLRRMVGVDIKAALFRSQDGLTIYEGPNV